jgi:hypothetical protein
MVDVVRRHCFGMAAPWLTILFQVANHVGAIPKQFQPIHYGPLFSAEQHFHPFCIPDDWNDQVQSEQCKCHLGNKNKG